MPEINYDPSEVERIKALYESGEGLRDAGQMYAHLLILLAELDWYRAKVDATVSYIGAVELVKRIVESADDLEDEAGR